MSMKGLEMTNSSLHLSKDSAESAYQYIFMQYIDTITNYLSGATGIALKAITDQIFLMRLLKNEFGIGLDNCEDSEMNNSYYKSICDKAKSVSESKGSKDNALLKYLLHIPK